MRVPTRKSETDRLALQDEPDRLLTPQAIERLKRTLEKVIAELPAAKLELQKAQEMGDLSENFGYQEAKRRLRSLNDRVVSLQERITRAVPIMAGSEDGEVRIGSTVKVETGGKQFTFQVLGSQETDPTRGFISYRSPLGAALIGKKAGEVASVDANGRKIEYKIIEVA